MQKLEETFNPLHYWEERLQAHPDITGVGYLGRSPRFVEQQYRSRMSQVELALRQYRLADLTGRSVLDIGSGTGIWLKFWHRHGARSVVGLDFAQPSVDRLRTEFPDDLIVKADVSTAPLPLPAAMRFDIISAFDVLLHIVDAEGLRQAISNLAHLCQPGGWLVISDAIVQGQGYVPTHTYAVHNKVRTVAGYKEVLKEHGFTIDSIRPATVLFSNPLEAPNRLAFLALSLGWKATGIWGRANVPASLLGPIAIRADQLACRLCTHGHSPSAKIIFARRMGKLP